MFEAAIRVVKASDKIMFENQKKKRKYMEIKRYFLYKSPSKRLFRYRIHSLLRRDNDRGSANILEYLTRITGLRVRHDY